MRQRLCVVTGCVKKSRLGRLFVNTLEDGTQVVLCGAHHVAGYRREPQSYGEGWAPLAGNHLGGFLHVSVEDAEHELTDDGGLGQLVDHLSGEVEGIDEDGNPLPVPHPFVHRF